MLFSGIICIRSKKQYKGVLEMRDVYEEHIRDIRGFKQGVFYDFIIINGVVLGGVAISESDTFYNMKDKKGDTVASILKEAVADFEAGKYNFNAVPRKSYR